MNHPTSKQPNPSKYRPNNRMLIPCHKEVVVATDKSKRSRIVTDRRPGEIIKSGDGQTYQVQVNGSLVKINHTRTYAQ